MDPTSSARTRFRLCDVILIRFLNLLAHTRESTYVCPTPLPSVLRSMRLFYRYGQDDKLLGPLRASLSADVMSLSILHDIDI
jgi:hypothetical protein